MKQFIVQSKLFLGLLGLYVVLVFWLPVNNVVRATYNLSPSAYHLLYFSVALPNMAAWLAAYYGYTKLRYYSKRVTDTADGPEFTRMAVGMGWVAWGFLIPALLAINLNAVANNHPHLLAPAVAGVNYAYVIITVISFTYFGRAAQSLVARYKIIPSMQSSNLLTLIFVAMAVILCYTLLHRLHNASAGSSFNAFYIPIWAIISTLLVPYLYAWFIGLQASQRLISIAWQTPGILYRRALISLAIGLSVVIVGSTGQQYFRSIIPRTGHLSLGPSLIMVYTFYLTSGLGCLILARGARQLTKIEEV